MQITLIPYPLTWEIRHKVMWPDRPLNYVKLPNDPEGIHYGLFVEKELISIVSVFINEREAQFRKFATLQKYQGSGYGSKLLSFTLSELQQKHVEKIWCNARVEKSAFYERFGLQLTDSTFTKGGIDYVIMEKIINQK